MVRVHVQKWVRFTTGASIDAIIDSEPTMPLFFHMVELHHRAARANLHVMDIRWDSAQFEHVVCTHQSVANQLHAMFRCPAGAETPTTYDPYKHLTHMGHLCNVHPTSLRRSQITQQVMRYNGREGPWHRLGQQDFLEKLASMANTSAHQIVNTYTVVPVGQLPEDDDQRHGDVFTYAGDADSAQSPMASPVVTPPSSPPLPPVVHVVSDDDVDDALPPYDSDSAGSSLPLPVLPVVSGTRAKKMKKVKKPKKLKRRSPKGVVRATLSPIPGRGRSLSPTGPLPPFPVKKKTTKKAKAKAKSKKLKRIAGKTKKTGVPHKRSMLQAVRRRLVPGIVAGEQ